MKTKLIIVTAFGLVLNQLNAQSVPNLMNYQGRVTDNSGVGIGTGTAVNRQIIFRIFDASTGGNRLWSEQQTVTLSEGEFSVLLGQGIDAVYTGATESPRPALSEVFSDAGDRYIEIVVDGGDNDLNAGDSAITPRQRITSTAYAFRASSADSVANGSDMQFNGSSDYGLGFYDATRPFGGAAVDGPVLYGLGGGALGSVNGATNTVALRWNDAGAVGIGTPSLGVLPGTTKLVVQGDDATTSPQQVIIRGESDPTRMLRLGYSTTGNWGSIQAFNASATALSLNPNGGNVGIGVTNPSASLTVGGGVLARGGLPGVNNGYAFTGNGGDEDSGMFSTGDGRIGLYSNGAERVYLDDDEFISNANFTTNSLATFNDDASFIQSTVPPNPGVNDSLGLNLINNDTTGTGANPNVVGISFGRSGTTRQAIVGGTFGADNLDFYTNGDLTTPKMRLGDDDASFIQSTVPPNPGVNDSLGLKLINDDTTGTGANPNVVGISFGRSGTTQQAIVGGTFGADNLDFYTQGELTIPKMRLDSAGNLSVGSTASPRGKLYVSGNVSTDNGAFAFYAKDGADHASTGPTTTTVGGVQPFSIYAENRVGASEFNAFSDARIKNVKGASDSQADLARLMAIQITDYSFRDTVKNDNCPQKKVIAQQVEQVYPQAVSQSTDVVPDIMKKAGIQDGWVTLATDLKKGEKVRLLAGTKTEKLCEVLEVNAGKFRVALDTAEKEVFVYGREVSDFRSVDYDAIAMLNVSATQQIKKDSDTAEEELRSENESLRARVAALENFVASAEKAKDSTEARLVALEKLLRRDAQIAASAVSFKAGQ